MAFWSPNPRSAIRSGGFGRKPPQGIGVATTDRCGLHPVATPAPSVTVVLWAGGLARGRPKFVTLGPYIRNPSRRPEEHAYEFYVPRPVPDPSADHVGIVVGSGPDHRRGWRNGARPYCRRTAHRLGVPSFCRPVPQGQTPPCTSIRTTGGHGCRPRQGGPPPPSHRVRSDPRVRPGERHDGRCPPRTGVRAHGRHPPAAFGPAAHGARRGRSRLDGRQSTAPAGGGHLPGHAALKRERPVADIPAPGGRHRCQHAELPSVQR